MEDVIVNKVAASGIVTIDLEEYYPKEEIVAFDLKPLLFMEMLLKEKDFRQKLKEINWQEYQDKYVAVFCSSDVIIPRWAFMLVATYLQPFAKDFIAGAKDELLNSLFIKNLESIDFATFQGKRVVIKGCGDLDVSASAYLEITKQLLPYAQSIMYGEPCSTVPVFKRK
ncbi:hypothetical protein A9P82_09805 [Arachidicoccus ginsenosidimutans]|uniref:DUF2480 family protein n=1 Tax=Arachidicoccus sp. BS20 TaxID=1850526 RepID=UPI0007F15992|nr:DUF2480 family protein [Arachidicoccus sp. BS20]ANI89559.1 hypothetical protein A9P82_09805 [Arachidicoccus sp. BS20]